MKILAHRGLWRQPAEKNTRSAFVAAAAAGYGIETDVRDSSGQLVVSHDPPRGGEMTFVDFLRLPGVTAHPLAVNIKADGLAGPVADALSAAGAEYAFVFDMSIPDMLNHLARRTPTFTRLSDLEPTPPLLDRCAGVWLDAFESDWWDTRVVADLLGRGKRVAVVSPELHGREPGGAWDKLKPLCREHGLLVCTDLPARFTKWCGLAAAGTL